MPIDEAALHSSLARMRDAAADADIAAAMRRTVDAVHDVFGYHGAGMMFITESGHLAYVAASNEAGRGLEQAQAAAGHGPCYESYVYARPVTSPDVHADPRWPTLSQHLSQRVRAVAGVPVLLAGSPIGTLNVYRETSVDWDDSHTGALTAYSALAADVLAGGLAARRHSDLAEQLQYALDYRVVIERAVGYLMGAHGLDAVTAFDTLRRRARDGRRRVAEVAREVLGE